MRGTNSLKNSLSDNKKVRFANMKIIDRAIDRGEFKSNGRRKGKIKAH